MCQGVGVGCDDFLQWDLYHRKNLLFLQLTNESVNTIDVAHSACAFSPGLAVLAGRAHRAWDRRWPVPVQCTMKPPGAVPVACVVTRPISAPPPRFSPPCAA